MLIISPSFSFFLRALALENANAKCKGNLAFQTPKCSASGNANVKCKGNLAFQAQKCSASRNANAKYCKIFCNTTTVQFDL